VKRVKRDDRSNGVSRGGRRAHKVFIAMSSIRRYISQTEGFKYIFLRLAEERVACVYPLSLDSHCFTQSVVAQSESFLLTEVPHGPVKVVRSREVEERKRITLNGIGLDIQPASDPAVFRVTFRENAKTHEGGVSLTRWPYPLPLLLPSVKVVDEETREEETRQDITHQLTRPQVFSILWVFVCEENICVSTVFFPSSVGATQHSSNAWSKLISHCCHDLADSLHLCSRDSFEDIVIVLKTDSLPPVEVVPLCNIFK